MTKELRICETPRRIHRLLGSAARTRIIPGILCSVSLFSVSPSSVILAQPPKESIIDSSGREMVHSPEGLIPKNPDLERRDDKTIATELEVAASDLREHLKKMRAAAIQYHLSDEGKNSPMVREVWIGYLAKGRKLHQAMVDAAYSEFEKTPDLKGTNAEFLYNVAARNANFDRFDGMLPAVKLLVEHGFSEKTFPLCAALTFAAHNEFDALKPFAESAIKEIQDSFETLAQDKSVPQEQKEKLAKDANEIIAMLLDFSDTDKQKKLWEEEQKARESDAAGEPLPRVLITTNKGAFEIELFENQVPNTVANFISLCEQGFYDGLPFHRVLTHFMAQTGCPNGDGSGSPPYRLPNELNKPNQRNFFRGTLGMALAANDPDSGGSQFFVCYLPRTHLNGGYVAFGRVLSGMDVLSDIAHINPDNKKEESPELPDQILSTKILFKRSHPYKPETLPPARN